MHSRGYSVDISTNNTTKIPVEKVLEELKKYKNSNDKTKFRFITDSGTFFFSSQEFKLGLNLIDEHVNKIERKTYVKKISIYKERKRPALI